MAKAFGNNADIEDSLEGQSGLAGYFYGPTYRIRITREGLVLSVKSRW